MSLVIVVSFVAMGGMQMLFSTRYWVSEKRALLTENARNVAEFTVSNAVQNPADPTSYILSGRDRADPADALHRRGRYGGGGGQRLQGRRQLGPFPGGADTP